MQKVNFLVVAVLMLALLPWGSFVPKFGSAAHRSAQVQTDAVAPQVMAATKLCKGPFLPGTPCNPVLAVLAAAVTLADLRPVAPRHRAAWHVLQGQQPPPLLGPPRAV